MQRHAVACRGVHGVCSGMQRHAVACSNHSKYLRVIYGYINIHHTLALGNTLLFYCESLLFSDAVTSGKQCSENSIRLARLAPDAPDAPRLPYLVWRLEEVYIFTPICYLPDSFFRVLLYRDILIIILHNSAGHDQLLLLPLTRHCYKN